MSFLMPSTPSPPPPPPPPANAPALPSTIQNGAAERQTLAAAEGQGMSGTDVTGGQGVKNSSVKTTKSLLGD
jgi:hypothetical protein